MNAYSLLGIKVTETSYDEIIKTINSKVRKENFLISPLASHTFVKAYFDQNLREILNSYDAIYPDSQWVRRSLNWLYGLSVEQRIYGPDLMLRICEEADKKGYRIFLYGTTLKTLKNLKALLENRFHSIRICAFEESSFAPLSESQIKILAGKIQKTGTDILFIALGSPLEQITAYRIHKQLKSKGLISIPVGAAFDFISGVKNQAPSWIGNKGFEWLYRLINEPVRLWKRYLIEGAVFMLLVIVQKFKMINH